jgi:hypothetical protein
MGASERAVSSGGAGAPVEIAMACELGLANWQGRGAILPGMSATSGTFTSPPAGTGGVLPGSGRVEFGQASASAMSMKWSALHDAAGVVAMLAGLAAETMRPELRNFPAVMRDAGGWRRELAEQGIEDLSAFMEPGLAALLAVNARGANAAPAALALWQEFLVARNGLMTLIPPVSEEAAPRRFT